MNWKLLVKGKPRNYEKVILVIIRELYELEVCISVCVGVCSWGSWEKCFPNQSYFKKNIIGLCLADKIASGEIGALHSVINSNGIRM